MSGMPDWSSECSTIFLHLCFIPTILRVTNAHIYKKSGLISFIKSSFFLRSCVIEHLLKK